MTKKFKQILLILLTITILASSRTSAIPTTSHPEEHFAHLPAGGRKALHGMVLFGANPYFLEHIPMLTAPHDFQIIAEVILKDEKGVALEFDFSQQGFTLKPDSKFSLNDYVAGRLKPFNASIYKGSFEREDGKIVEGLENVSVEIKSYKLIRQLPSESKEKSIQLSDGKNTFVSLVISPNQNLQKIINIKTGKTLWCVIAPDFFDPCP